MLSAQLDGEDDPADRPLVDEHLAGCAGCREWLDRAAAVNRLTSTRMAVAPDLSEAILAALPATSPRESSQEPKRESSQEPKRESSRGSRRGPLRESSQEPKRESRRGPRRKSSRELEQGPLRGSVRASLGGVLRGALRGGRVPVAAALFVALAAVGAVQLILGLDQIGGGVVAGGHEHTAAAADPGHLWHESAAWNVAVGAGYLFIALRRVRPSGLVPMLTAFVGMLVLLSVNDLSGGRVDATRLVSHGFVILGYLLIVTLSRIPGGFVSTPPGVRSGAGSGWTARFADEEEEIEPAPRPGLRLVPRGPMTAQEEERRAA
ncbi:Putative zinc-finger [Paractinoplanes atraurantiacus]|uniref:Putative zinc-finger n=1 Tax=Paractinoplanes atraurantiacus TaxID=1036182 RepID=A0A285K8W0_9ACTN|nr:Putative zinc-finger [Actinoplanes atraurantiacus]